MLAAAAAAKNVCQGGYISEIPFLACPKLLMAARIRPLAFNAKSGLRFLSCHDFEKDTQPIPPKLVTAGIRTKICHI
jgi:hypothetical protein